MLFLTRGTLWVSALYFGVIILLGFKSAAAETSVTLAWDPSPSPGIVAYRVYYGTVSGNYSQMVETTNATSAKASGLQTGVTYYFAATALDLTGLESEFSEEISYTPATPNRPTLQFQMTSSSEATIVSSGQPGQTYELEASTDLSSWTRIAAAAADASGRVSFTDAAASTFPRRFYRVSNVSLPAMVEQAVR